MGLEGPAVLSDLQKKKLSRYFRVLDADGDGEIERSDYEQRVAAFAKEFGCAPGSPRYASIQRAWMDQWKGLVAAADGDDDRKVSLAEFLAMHDEAIQDRERLYGVLLSVARWILETADVDGNGTLSRPELLKALLASGLSEAEASESFRRLDRDGDETITKAEFLSCAAAFYTSDDPGAPGNWLFGAFEDV